MRPLDLFYTQVVSNSKPCFPDRRQLCRLRGMAYHFPVVDLWVPDQIRGGCSMSFRPTWRCFSVLLLAGLFVCAANGQTTTSGALAGVVADKSNAVVTDANVEVRDNAKATTQTTKTDREGVYRFFFLLPGRYTLTITHTGFREAKRTVDVLLGTAVSVNMTLAIATPAIEITVAAEVPLLQAENGDFSTDIDQEQISNLPNSGNDLTYIAQTSPGVVMNTDGGAGNFSSLGMPGTSNLFTLNGMNDNDMSFDLNQTGPLGLLLGQNEIQEVTVLTNGYSGQFGTLAGTNVNYMTKSGSNGFHGNAKYFWNGRVLNANDWISKAFGQPRPFAIANQWAGSMGGPFRKDKLFFFFNTEGLHLTLPLIFPTVVPSAEFEAATMANIDKKFGPTSPSHDFYRQIFDLYNVARGTHTVQSGNFFDPIGCDASFNLGGLPCAVNFVKIETQPIHESLISGRIDWNATSKDRVFLLLQYDHGINSAVDPISPLFNIETDQPWWQGQLVQTHTFGVSAANQLVLGGWWRSSIFQPKNLRQIPPTFSTRLGWCDGGSCSFSNLGLDLGAPVGRKTTQWQISDDLVWTIGSHKLGVGANLLRVLDTNYFYGYGAAGDLLPFSLDAFYQGGFDANGGEGDFTALNQSFALARSRHVASYNLGVYAQDEWRARPNLAFTLALRIEHQSNPVCADHCFARLAGSFESVTHDPNQPYNQAILINQSGAYPDLNSILWAPRIGFAWQPLGVSHNMVLRGGIGIFYDSLPGVLADFLTLNPPLSNQFRLINNNLAPGETDSLFREAANSNGAFLNAFSAGDTFSQIKSQVPGFSPPAFVNPSRKTLSPQYQKWSLEMQQVFGANTSVTIGYFGNHGIHELIQNGSANAYGFGSLPPGQCTSPPVPPCSDPRFSTVESITSVGVSNYHGVLTSFKHRFGGHSQGFLQVNYTYGRAFDEVSNGGLLLFINGAGGNPINPQDPNNPRGAYGPADYDVRHSFNAGYVWKPPLRALLGNRGSDYLVDGWQISGTVFARGGFRYTVYDNLKAALLAAKNFAGPIYAVPAHPLGKQLSCGRGAAIPAVSMPCQTPQVLQDGTSPNPAAQFIQAGCTTGFNVGNLPNPSDPADPCGGPVVTFVQQRNRFHGPRYFNADLTIMKNIRLPGWEKGQFQIGFQFFNVFNHPNFGMPDGFSSASTFGQIVYTASPPTGILGRGVSARMIQVKAQLDF
jgi:hypothetical protein